ncbi:MAG TPA: amidinotransferase [Candidatus Krumholzibacteria bacterium]|nr:amidinotransferase [Candidatus Krumholzibacteria bacterium]
MHRFALTREPGSDLFRGLTTAGLGAPDLLMARAQHASYVAALREQGLEVTVLPALEGCPDACFVEDTAVIVPGLSVVTRPGAPSRRGETATIAAALPVDRPQVTIAAPGTLDGGDVLVVDRTCWIGLSGRTNAEGAGQLVEALAPLGLDCRLVPVGEGLHLKSSLSHLGGRRLLMTEQLAALDVFAGWDIMVVPAAEAYACNALWLDGRLLVPTGYPRTVALLAAKGLALLELDMSEYRKLDGGLTCLSLRF